MYVVHANTHTITLKISRPQADYPLENLVLHYNVDTQTYDEYLIQYDISLEQLEQIENGIDFELQDENQMIVRQLENGTLNDMMAKLCRNNCTTIDVMCESGAHAPGQSCSLDDEDQPYTYQSCSLICTSPNTTIIDAGDSSSGGGGNMVTNPNVSTPNTPQISTIFQLTTQYLSGVHSWWWASQATPSQKSAMETFLDNSKDSQGYYSQEALAFVKEAIQILLNNLDAEVDWEEKIILDPSFEGNQQLLDVYNTLKSGNNTIGDYIDNFMSENSVAHLKIKTDDNFKSNFIEEFWSAGGVTSLPENYLITITLNTDVNLPASNLNNHPEIVQALTLLHEIIHAEVFRKMLSVAQEPEIPWTVDFIKNELKDDFGGLADYYTRFWLELPPNEEPNQAQHNLMASHYIETMALALAEFDNYQHPFEYYETISWIGLKETKAWENKSQEERDYINCMINNLINNLTNDC